MLEDFELPDSQHQDEEYLKQALIKKHELNSLILYCCPTASHYPAG